MDAPRQAKGHCDLPGCHRNGQSRTDGRPCNSGGVESILERSGIRAVAGSWHGRLGRLLGLGLFEASPAWSQARSDFNPYRAGNCHDFSIHIPWWNIARIVRTRDSFRRFRACRNVAS